MVASAADRHVVSWIEKKEVWGSLSQSQGRRREGGVRLSSCWVCKRRGGGKRGRSFGPRKKTRKRDGRRDRSTSVGSDKHEKKEARGERSNLLEWNKRRGKGGGEK